MRTIPLTKGFLAMIDDEDYENLKRFKWRVRCDPCNRYACTLQDGRSIQMHRMILDAKPDDLVDHADGNGLNNTRANIRLCDKYENSHNSNRPSLYPYRGVRPTKRARKWHACITHYGHREYLGSFDNPILAAKAYDEAARTYFGDFAKLNFPRQI